MFASLRLKQRTDYFNRNIDDGVQHLCCKAVEPLHQDAWSVTLSDLLLDRQGYITSDGAREGDLAKHGGQSGRDPVQNSLRNSNSHVAELLGWHVEGGNQNPCTTFGTTSITISRGRSSLELGTTCCCSIKLLAY